MTTIDKVSPVSKALTPVAALFLLMDAPDYGYSLIQRLKREGFRHVQAGVLYPQLRALEAEGYLDSEWHVASQGPPRKIYRLTTQGHEFARQQKKQIVDTMQSFYRISGEANS
ncbi:hypothetical protein KEM60_00707 [Austwickia sp. TVS 96-490-7B]|uniref:PadR family transcriptional regulator n=1 Tax=Austwickia sp. TVS 96-490-7B TaxID=2830843 RepID=UPI001C597F37|nr:PadR family transcriptional regulator [Austwickia sp. TVS 96-490-7B]MBW3084519.1 hypothetical protein [Austwickia sp. TVS 96-490-7B]